ncbi:MAG TPA: YHS domain-containing protein [Planctomycetaceae bacterium]|nr:YHS domain-containing protein [Planctomycetaceae bacterium]
MTDDHRACCHTPSQLPVLSETAVDPVCGMTVDPQNAAGSHAYKGTTYYFCSTHCVAKFQADPERFLKTTTTPASTALASAGPYTCPMHPEIVQDGPGTCPKCGMALEPMQPSAESGPDPELISMPQRF